MFRLFPHGGVVYVFSWHAGTKKQRICNGWVLPNSSFIKVYIYIYIFLEPEPIYCGMCGMVSEVIFPEIFYFLGVSHPSRM